MSSKVIRRDHALRHIPVPGALLSLEGVRSRLDAPPAGPVEWIGTCRDDGREVRTWAQLWKSAVDICAAQLGVSADRIECIRADQQRLSGSGAA